MAEKVGRNDPCPCGSGKKFKKCCEQRLGKTKFQASIIQSGMSSGSDLKGKATKISTDFFNRPPPSQKDLSEIRENMPKHPPEADKPM